MFFYLYKKSLKQLRDKNATKEEIKNDWYIFKHSYRMSYIATVLCTSVLSIFLSLYLCGIGLALCIISLTTKLYFFSIFVIPILFLILMSEIIFQKRNKWIKEGKELDKFLEIVLDKFHNIYLINPFVISNKDWKTLKKISKKNYDRIRSFESQTDCYECTFYIANMLRKSKLKIMWLLCDQQNKKFGHAVLVKGNWIYDTNRRKTYSKKKYLQHTNSKIFCEIDISKYLVKNSKGIELIIEDGLDSVGVYVVLQKYWDEFKNFCEINGGIRCTNDKPVTDENQE